MTTILYRLWDAKNPLEQASKCTPLSANWSMHMRVFIRACNHLTYCNHCWRWGGTATGCVRALCEVAEGMQGMQPSAALMFYLCQPRLLAPLAYLENMQNSDDMVGSEPITPGRSTNHQATALPMQNMVIPLYQHFFWHKDTHYINAAK